jgi:uncharacterized protein
MDTCRITHHASGVVLALEARRAVSVGARLKGLLGTSELPSGQGLIIDGCTSIHTWGMQYAIDVLFIDRNSLVIHMIHTMHPWRMSWVYWKSARVIELPANLLTQIHCKISDLIDIE